MLHYGIPAYRLPRADLMREIHRIEAMGVASPWDAGRGRPRRDGRRSFDACFIAIGTHDGNHLDIPAADARR